uniref:Putative zinc finger protein n=1 Tax=Corethrella appendiculata TaxID=1370023 RepID=U5ES30_9DIPT
MSAQNDSPVVKALMDNIFGSLPTQNVPQSLLCEACNVSLTSQICMDAHLVGKKHQKRVKLLARTGGVKQKNTSSAGASSTNASKPTIVPSVQTNPATGTTSVVPGGIVAPAGTTKPQICPPPVQMQHQKRFAGTFSSSKSNKKKKKKQKFGPNVTKESVKEMFHSQFVSAGTLTNKPYVHELKSVMNFYCSKCNMHMISKEQYDIHLTSNQHKFTVQQAEELQQQTIELTKEKMTAPYYLSNSKNTNYYPKQDYTNQQQSSTPYNYDYSQYYAFYNYNPAAYATLQQQQGTVNVPGNTETTNQN